MMDRLGKILLAMPADEGYEQPCKPAVPRPSMQASCRPIHPTAPG
jgi:hypothetical protein